MPPNGGEGRGGGLYNFNYRSDGQIGPFSAAEGGARDPLNWNSRSIETPKELIRVISAPPLFATSPPNSDPSSRPAAMLDSSSTYNRSDADCTQLSGRCCICFHPRNWYHWNQDKKWLKMMYISEKSNGPFLKFLHHKFLSGYPRNIWCQGQL